MKTNKLLKPNRIEGFKISHVPKEKILRNATAIIGDRSPTKILRRRQRAKRQIRKIYIQKLTFKFTFQ